MPEYQDHLHSSTLVHASCPSSSNRRGSYTSPATSTGHPSIDNIFHQQHVYTCLPLFPPLSDASLPPLISKFIPLMLKKSSNGTRRLVPAPLPSALLVVLDRALLFRFCRARCFGGWSVLSGVSACVSWLCWSCSALSLLASMFTSRSWLVGYVCEERKTKAGGVVGCWCWLFPKTAGGGRAMDAASGGVCCCCAVCSGSCLCAVSLICSGL